MFLVLKSQTEYEECNSAFYDYIDETYNIHVTRTKESTFIDTIEMPDEIYTMLLLMIQGRHIDEFFK